MIQKLTLNGKWKKRIPKRENSIFEFLPGVNLLIGPNGSGKSTIIQSIKTFIKSKNQKDKSDIELITGNKNIFIFDFEKDSFRTKSYFSSTNVKFQVSSMFSSHGETTKALINGLSSDNLENLTLVFDEPDQALDIDGINLLIEQLKICKAEQIIMSVHHPALILSNFHVIELEPGYKYLVHKEIKEIIKRNKTFIHFLMKK
jgi:ABC-type multidrug transport system ATPase subunit